jgi:DNA-binding Lrp family transcriptional regulator
MTLAREKEFVKKLTDEKRVIHFLKTEGSYDYAFVIAVKSNRELDEFLTELKTRFKDDIDDLFVSIVIYSRIFKLDKLLLEARTGTLKFDKYSDERKTSS